MWQQEFTWFFALFHHEFRQGNLIACEGLMGLALAHCFGFYNVSSLPIMEKGEQFLRVIGIFALLCSHYKICL